MCNSVTIVIPKILIQKYTYIIDVDRTYLAICNKGTIKYIHGHLKLDIFATQRF